MPKTSSQRGRGTPAGRRAPAKEQIKRATSTHRPAKAARKPQAPAKTWHDFFLAELRKCGNVRAACARAKIERSTAYKARKEDAAFAEQWKAALDDAIDDLESEAWHRAQVGDVKYLFYQGEPIELNGKPVIERQKSDTLMALLLKAHRPEKYRERAETLNFNLDVGNLTDDQLERIAHGEDVSAVLATPGAGGIGTAPPVESESGDRAVESAPTEPPPAARV